MGVGAGQPRGLPLRMEAGRLLAEMGGWLPCRRFSWQGRLRLMAWQLSYFVLPAWRG